MPVELKQLQADQAAPLLGALVQLLQDAVDRGASVGFLTPLSTARAQAYWQGVVDQMANGAKHLWVATDQQALLGAVQLEPCQRDNGRQRGEVQKLFVMGSARRLGVAGQLMDTLEAFAKHTGIRTLHLDTEDGSAAELFYQGRDYQRVGVIPDYAQSSHGAPCGTAIYYKQLGSTSAKDTA